MEKNKPLVLVIDEAKKQYNDLTNRVLDAGVPITVIRMIIENLYNILTDIGRKELELALQAYEENKAMQQEQNKEEKTKEK